MERVHDTARRSPPNGPELPGKPLGFFDLAREIRDQIYEELLSNDKAFCSFPENTFYLCDTVLDHATHISRQFTEELWERAQKVSHMQRGDVYGSDTWFWHPTSPKSGLPLHVSEVSNIRLRLLTEIYNTHDITQCKPKRPICYCFFTICPELLESFDELRNPKTCSLTIFSDVSEELQQCVEDEKRRQQALLTSHNQVLEHLFMNFSSDFKTLHIYFLYEVLEFRNDRELVFQDFAESYTAMLESGEHATRE